MPVRQLELENFRAFRKAEMRFPRTGLVLVAGPNNVGKTALLSGLDALAGDYGDLASLRYGGAEEPARLSATFELDQAERAAILENAAGGQWLLDAGVLSSLQFGSNSGKISRWCSARYSGTGQMSACNPWPGCGWYRAGRTRRTATK
jgi:predicted ATP-dependent endonuclease of OLD family